MALTVDGHQRTYEEAIADFGTWTSDYESVVDPLRRAARVIAALAHVMAQVIETQTQAMTHTSDQIAVVNDVLKLVNEGITHSKDNASETTDIEWMEGTQEELAVAISVFNASGIKSKEDSPTEGMYSLREDSPGEWTIMISPRNLGYVQLALQTDVEKLSSTQQNDQMRVQTAVGRYNYMTDLISSLTKKGETQSDTVGNGIRT